MGTVPRATQTVQATFGYPVAAGLIVLALVGGFLASRYPRWHRRHDISARLARLRI